MKWAHLMLLIGGHIDLQICCLNQTIQCFLFGVFVLLDPKTLVHVYAPKNQIVLS